MTKKQFENKYSLDNVNKKWFDSISDKEYTENINKATISGKTTKVWKDIIKRFFTNKWNVIFLSIFVVLIIVILVGSTFSSFSPTEAVSKAQTEQIKYMAPSAAISTYQGTLHEIQVNVDKTIIYSTGDHLAGGGGILRSSSFNINTGEWTIKFANAYHIDTILGTDEIGRSVWQRLMASSKFSIGLAIIVATIETTVGTIVGLYLGYHAGKWIDTYFMRVVEIISAIPALLLITIFVLILGTSFSSFLISLIIIGWIGPVYVTRMFTIKIKNSEFIMASISLGASTNRIILRHILPNIFGRILVSFVHRIPSVIFIETTLIFLGIQVGGVDHNTLGSMLEQARMLEALNHNALYLISSASVLLIFTLSLQIIANGIRDSFDAKVVG